MGPASAGPGGTHEIWAQSKVDLVLPVIAGIQEQAKWNKTPLGPPTNEYTHNALDRQETHVDVRTLKHSVPREGGRHPTATIALACRGGGTPTKQWRTQTQIWGTVHAARVSSEQ